MPKMLVELTSNKVAQLNRWCRVITIDGKPVKGIYVRFALAYDCNGNTLPIIPSTEEPVYVEMEYNGVNYP